MSARSAQDLLREIKATIREISASDLLTQSAAARGALLIDTREADEVAKGQIPTAIHIPRGFLELKIENLEPNRSREIILYCAGGNRSAFAAESLQRLGYQNVVSLAGGFSGWQSAGGSMEVKTGLTAEQRDRYHRHLLLPEVGEEGQLKLLAAKVLIIGAGGLGCPAALYLAAAGVGTIGLVDADTIDRSNLQRQILYTEGDVGKSKVDVARARLLALNPDCKIPLHPVRLNRDNAREILAGYDYVVNGCDNFPTRYLVNDACFFLGKPLIDGSIFRFDGQASIHIPGKGPCYRCLYPEPPPPELAPSCQEAGVFGVLPGLVGSMQAVETIKLILGLGTSLMGRLLTFDAKTMKFRELRLHRDPDCLLCGPNPTVTDLIDYEGFCTFTGS